MPPVPHVTLSGLILLVLVADSDAFACLVAQRPPSPERLRMHEDMRRQLAMSQVLLAASLMIP